MNAFVMRNKPGHVDRLEETFSSNEIIIGWVITAGSFNEDAKKVANEQNIRVIEGTELAEMLVNSGVLK